MGNAVMFQRTLFEPEHELFRDSYRTFLKRFVAPYHQQWETDKIVDRDVWLEAGKQGFLGMGMPEEYGGGGNPDFRYNAIITEETTAGGFSGLGFAMHNDMVAPYLVRLATAEQKARWLPKFCTGEYITALAMTEPGAGSDLQGIRTRAVRDGDDWVLNGAKMFITNGIHADLVIVFAQTDPDKGSLGYSLLVVERGMAGFERGRKLDKIGLDAQDTAELSFTDVRVPSTNVLGTVGDGLIYLMQNLPQERLDRLDVGGGDGGHVGLDAGIRSAAPGVRPAHRKLPEHPVRAGGIGHRGHRDADHGRRVHPVARRRKTHRGAGGDGQVVGDRGLRPARRPVPATARRLRLHAGVSDRQGLSRCPGADDLRRHDGDHERDHRPSAVPVGPGIRGPVRRPCACSR